MTDERYQRVKALFVRAHELDREARARFLDAECDAELRGTVEELLREHDQPDDAFDAVPARIPERIGSYRVLDVIGEGGMGIVYRAEQENPRRTVALKLIRPELASDSLLRRFELEAQVLGRLQHKGIAQIIEAGTADFGEGRRQPFFAMEWVQGSSLTRHLRDRATTVEERVELVAAVCDAVEHAHQKGVIHRDLKPGNILVDDSGQPKVLDFGIARAVDSDADFTSAVTQRGHLIGTLAYMSPEQAGGDPTHVDTRSDVYSLGVVGYEVLSGQVPHVLDGKTLNESLRIITEQDPRRLGAVDRALRGDLETILAKALEKEKERRYSSARELGADLRRFVANEPISARPATTTYQLRKFARRHRGLVIGATAAVLALIAGTITASVFAVNARAEARRADLAAEAAQRQATRAQEVTRFMVDMYEVSDPELGNGDEITAREILDRSAARIATELRREPRLRASLMLTIGEVYSVIGLFDSAGPLLTGAVEIVANDGEAEPVDRCNASGAMARHLVRVGRYDEGLVYAEEAARVARAHFTLEDALRIRTERDLAVAYARVRRFDESMVLLDRCQAAYEAMAAPSELDLAEVLVTQGTLRSMMDEHAEAREYLERALEIQDRLLPVDHPRLALTLNSLAGAQFYLRDAATALQLLERALAIETAAMPPGHPRLLRRRINIGIMQSQLGRYDEAEHGFREVIESMQKGGLVADPELMNAPLSLGRVYLETGRFELAREVLHGARKMAESLVSPSPSLLGTIGHNLGEVESKLENYDVSEREYRGALELRELAHGRVSTQAALSAMMLADLLRFGGRSDEEVALRRRVYESWERSRNPMLQTAAPDLAAALRDAGRESEAVEIEARVESGGASAEE